MLSYAMDVGALSPILWGYEEREKLMEFYEAASGARLHANYLPAMAAFRAICRRAWLTGSGNGARHSRNSSTTCWNLLTGNRIWKQRTVDIGIMTQEQALAWGFSGPNIARQRRAVGSAPRAALRDVRPSGIRCADRAQWRLL